MHTTVCSVSFGRRRILATLLLLAGVAAAPLLRPRPAFAAPPVAPVTAAPDSIQPGLTLTIESSGKTDARSARLIALAVLDKTAPTPFLPAGPFKAVWEGDITVPLRGDFIFSAAGNGKISVKIGDRVAFEAAGENLDPSDVAAKPARLKKGKNPITVTYESPATGDAVIRLYWSSQGEFLPEPIDPTRFSHDTSTPALATATQLRRGRELFADLRCAKCHAVDPALLGEGSMPELAMDAPSLQGIGTRLKGSWIQRWISDPHALRPDTSMPKLAAIADPTSALDLAVYLSMLGEKKDAQKVQETTADDAKAGGKLIATLGCIGCHTLPDAASDPKADAARIPWRNLRTKYQPAGLVAFLKQPEEHFKWIRMPNFHLSDLEASHIAAFLLKGITPPEAALVGNPQRGRQIMIDAGCLACHSLGEKMMAENRLRAPALAAIPADGWSRGCMGKDDATRGKAPDFSFSDPQRAALLAFAATDRSSLKQDAWPEFAERQITSLRCIACHNRDEKTDLWDDLLKETKALGGGEQANVESDQANTAKGPPGEPAPGSGDQSRPNLTWAGEKLRPEWAEAFIAGKIPYKPRVWLTARMPSFPARAHGLAHGLALEHGFGVTAPIGEPTDAESATAGRKLAGRDGGFGCIQCHGIGKVPPLAPFEAPSINFTHVSDRLRKEYYDRWMRNPARIVPTTKMPAFADTEMKTSLTDVLEGDAAKQFNGLWQYLLSADKIQPPEEAPQ